MLVLLVGCLNENRNPDIILHFFARVPFVKEKSNLSRYFVCFCVLGIFEFLACFMEDYIEDMQRTRSYTSRLLLKIDLLICSFVILQF